MPRIRANAAADDPSADVTSGRRSDLGRASPGRGLIAGSPAAGRRLIAGSPAADY
jgi:hypothetical protein